MISTRFFALIAVVVLASASTLQAATTQAPTTGPAATEAPTTTAPTTTTVAPTTTVETTQAPTTVEVLNATDDYNGTLLNDTTLANWGPDGDNGATSTLFGVTVVLAPIMTVFYHLH